MAIMEVIIQAVDRASGVLKDIQGNAGNLSNTLGATGAQWDQTGQSVSRAGMEVTKMAAPIIAVGTAAIMTVSRFDDSMSKVQAISGASGEELEKLREAAKDMGSTTRYSASEAAEAMSFLALAGWDTNQILEATPQMLSLASAGAMDLATAADIVSDTMSMFTMDASDAGRAADVFAAASSQSNTDVQQLGEAMKYAGATASAAGMDIEQTASVLGILADNGIKGGMAGTTLNGMLRDMRDNAKDGAIAIGETAVAVYEADGSMRDLGSIMGDVNVATADMTTEQRDAAMSAIFGQQAIRGVNVMLATGAERYEELEHAMYNSTGTADDMAATMEDNVGGAFRALKSQTEGILIQLGEQLAPIIKDVLIPALQRFGERIGALIDWFSNLSPGMQSTILSLLGIFVAAGPVLMILGKFISIIGKLMVLFSKIGPLIATIGKGLGLLGGFFKMLIPGILGAVKAAWAFTAALLANPITWIIIAIVALIAAIYLLWKNWDQVSEWLVNAWEWIKEKAAAIWDSIKEFFSKFWEGLKEVFSKALQFVKDLFFKYHPLGWIIENWDKIKNFFGKTWENIKGIFTGGLGGTFDTIKDRFGAIFDFIRGIWDSIIGFFVNIWDNIKALFTGGLGGTFDVVKERFGAVFDFINKIWTTIRDFFSQVWERIKGIFSGGLSGIWEAVKKAFNDYQAFIQRTLQAIQNFLSGAWNSIRNAAVNAWNAIRNGVTAAAGNLSQGIRDTINRAIDFVRGLPGQMLQIGKDIIQGLINGIRNMAGNLGGALRGVVDNAVGSAKKFLGIKSPSKVFEQIGQGGIGAGLIKGLKQAQKPAAKATLDLVGARPGAHPGIASQRESGGGTRQMHHLIEFKNLPPGMDEDRLAKIIAKILRRPDLMEEIDVINYENFRLATGRA